MNLPGKRTARGPALGNPPEATLSLPFFGIGATLSKLPANISNTACEQPKHPLATVFLQPPKMDPSVVVYPPNRGDVAQPPLVSS